MAANPKIMNEKAVTFKLNGEAIEAEPIKQPCA